MYNWITSLYTWTERNIVNELYFNKNENETKLETHTLWLQPKLNYKNIMEEPLLWKFLCH